MNLPQIVSRDEWLAARKELLEKEKEETKRRDALRAERSNLPMVKVEKEYVFDGPDGEVSLLDMFEGRRQLIVQHFMFDPEWEYGCPSCTFALDDFGDISHLHDLDTSYAVVSRAPLEKLESWNQKRGWTVSWYSSHGSDFNYDYHATIDGHIAPVYVNYRTADELEKAGMPSDMKGEIPGYSVFIRDGEKIFHTYSTYARGVELLNSSTQFIDLTPLGRQEG
ncbi:MAG: DUF899 domain-containing protein [Rubrobacteraceae bacterium]